MSPSPVLLVGDLHLGPDTPTSTGNALARLVAAHPGHELVLLGDSFDLSVDPRPATSLTTARCWLERQPAAVAALRRHLAEHQGSITMLLGNHDTNLAIPPVELSLRSLLGRDTDATLKVEPWWIHRWGLHLEHGHVWDPDNAPTHPLIIPTPETEPFGISLTRRVLAPSNALCFAHAHETTPFRGFTQAFRHLGRQAPFLIGRYYLTALSLVGRAFPSNFASENERGRAALIRFLQASPLAPRVVEQMLALRPVPRHHLFWESVARLYLDRSLASLTLLASPLVAVTARQPHWLWGAFLAAGYLAGSIAQKKSRYQGQIPTRLRMAGKMLHALTHTRAVVFGHTHVPEESSGYLNLGSFGFPGPRGRPFLRLDREGHLFRGYLSEIPGSENALIPVAIDP